MMYVKREGYVLVLSIMLMGMLMVLVTSVVQRVLVTRQTARLTTERMKAQELAWSGLQIAYAQLAQKSKEVVEKLPAPQQAGEKTQKPADDRLRMIEYSSWWQEYELKREIEGVDGTIVLYVVPESGKINLNGLYDFKQKKWYSDQFFNARQLIQLVSERLRPLLGNVNLVDILEKFFKEKNGPIEDITQLKSIKEFEKLDALFFARPPEKEAPFRPALADLFTVARDDRGLNPACLSHSVAWLINPQSLDSAQVRKIRAQIAPEIKETMDWTKNWEKLLQPLYKKSYTDIPRDLKILFNPKFEGSIFSVVSYGKINTVTQALYVLVERTLARDQRVQYIIRKMYWL